MKDKLLEIFFIGRFYCFIVIDSIIVWFTEHYYKLAGIKYYKQRGKFSNKIIRL